MAEKRKRVIPDDSDEDESGQEDEEPPPANNKRAKKPTLKKSLTDKENVNSEVKKLAALKKQVAKLSKKLKESDEIDPSKDVDEFSDGFESEEETNGNRGFSSSITPLAVVAVTNKVTKTPLKRVGPAAAKAPKKARVSSNAFKAIPIISSSDFSEPSSQVDVDTNHSGVESEDKCPSLEVSSSTNTTAAKRAKDSTHADQATSTPEQKVDAYVSSSSDTTPAKRADRSSPVAQTTRVPELKVPAYRSGAEISDKKPKAADYEDIVNALIVRAAAEYESLISTKDAFPDTATRNKWAKKCWINAGIDADERYVLTDRINSLLRKRGSRIRGFILVQIRPLVVTFLGFKRSGEPRSVKWNQELAIKLKTQSAFHYKDSETLTGFAQGKVILEILFAVWFETKTSAGVVFAKLFNPIPLETMALIFTIIDFCIDEWSTGKFVKATLWEKDIIGRHEVYRKDLEEWSEINPKVVESIRKKFYNRACRNAGVLETFTVKQTLIGEMKDRARNELEGRTGETDSEAGE